MEFEKLQKEMITAMKEGKKARKDSISVLVSAAKKIAIDGGTRDNITEEIVNTAIGKELKKIKEQIELCPKDREDLLNEYKERLAVFEEFAPAMLSSEEVKKILTEKYAEVLATKDKGKIMKAVMVELKGKAEGKVISEVVAKLCE